MGTRSPGAVLLSLVQRVARRLGVEVGFKKYKPPFEPQVLDRFRAQIEQTREQSPQFTVIEEFRDDANPHPAHYIDFECEFVSEQIRLHEPAQILDIGSYRHWLIGVMAHYPVTTIDVRKRESSLANETTLTGDIDDFEWPQASVDMVTSLHTIEHFGLGRYGDQFNLAADAKAVTGMLQAIRPGGYFVLSVPVTRGPACIAFNSHRIYTLDMVRKWTQELTCLEERFIKRKPARLCSESEIADSLGEFDVYCGCFRKASGP